MKPDEQPEWQKRLTWVLVYAIGIALVGSSTLGINGILSSPKKRPKPVTATPANLQTAFVQITETARSIAWTEHVLRSSTLTAEKTQTAALSATLTSEAITPTPVIAPTVEEGLQALPNDTQTDSVLLLERENSDQSSAQSIYQVSVDGKREILATLDNHTVNRMEDSWILLGNGSLGINLNDVWYEIEVVNAQPSDNGLTEVRKILGDDFAPIFGPILVHDGLILMAGEGDPAVNLYLLRDDSLIQLTDARTIFPEAIEPLLSASVEFIAERPQHDGFLYRARVRDGEGTDHNALFWHDLNESHPMPFFGKDPVWSMDGDSLAGSRFNDETTLYELWIVDLVSGEETFIANACNPQFSPDGAWLAYDLHVNATWTAYTDCYASGQVEALNLETGERVLLSDGLPDFVTLIGWR